jgi:hypothetical protein
LLVQQRFELLRIAPANIGDGQHGNNHNSVMFDMNHLRQEIEISAIVQFHDLVAVATGNNA